MKGDKWGSRLLFALITLAVLMAWVSSGLAHDQRTAKNIAARKAAIVQSAHQAGFVVRKDWIDSYTWTATVFHGSCKPSTVYFDKQNKPFLFYDGLPPVYLTAKNVASALQC